MVEAGEGLEVFEGVVLFDDIPRHSDWRATDEDRRGTVYDELLRDEDREVPLDDE